jgi:hypothetical protein
MCVSHHWDVVVVEQRRLLDGRIAHRERDSFVGGARHRDSVQLNGVVRRRIL